MININEKFEPSQNRGPLGKALPNMIFSKIKRQIFSIIINNQTNLSEVKFDYDYMKLSFEVITTR